MIVRCPYSISSHQKETFPLRETMCFLEKMQAPSVHQLDDDNLTWDAPEKKTTFLIRQGPYFRRHEGRIVAVQTCCSTDSSNCAVDVTIRNVECTRWRRRRRGQRQSHQGRSHAPRSCSMLPPPLFALWIDQRECRPNACNNRSSIFRIVPTLLQSVCLPSCG